MNTTEAGDKANLTAP